MDLIINHNWTIKNISYSFLIRKGCKYVESRDIYVYTFPVNRWNDLNTLMCTIVIFPEDRSVNVNVCSNEGYPYPPFYDPNLGGYEEFITRINQNILNKFKFLGIYEPKQKHRKNNKEKIKK